MTTLRLTCVDCEKTEELEADITVRGVPLLTWWATERRHRCRDCHAAAVAPLLSDPLAPSVKVRRDARPTSARAANAAFPRTGTQRWRVLMCIAESQGVTDDEVIVSTGVPHQSVGPRRLELEEGGWVQPSGQYRKTRSNKDAIVWVLTEDGRAALAGKYNPTLQEQK